MKSRMEQVVLWRRPAKRGPHTPLVVLLHGRGADERDLIDVADALPPTFAYASLRAPVPLEDGGFTWYANRGPGRPVAESLRASVDALRTWLDGPEAGAPKRVFLLGFSAGMMMAGALLLDDPARFAGAVLLSGALAFDAGIPVTPERLRGIPVFSGRGSSDDVIAAELVRRTLTYLRETSGALFTEREYPIGHSISGRELADIRDWLESA